MQGPIVANEPIVGGQSETRLSYRSITAMFWHHFPYIVHHSVSLVHSKLFDKDFLKTISISWDGFDK